MKQLKWFTLVELLIVIVIIGILMSALLPKLQGAQDIARDTARQLAIRDLQAGMAGYYSLNGRWPASWTNASGDCNTLRDKLINESNLMSSLPKEPNENNVNSFNGLTWEGQYLFFVLDKNRTHWAGLLLVAKTETPWKSNYVCGYGVQNNEECKITDVTTGNAVPCRSVVLTGWTEGYYTWDGTCYYNNADQLRYISTY